MNKKMKLLIVTTIFAGGISAQRNAPPATYSSDEGAKGFKKENIFIGGGLNIGFASNTFGVGGTPEIGYTVAQWLDAGLGFNINYASQGADQFYNGNVRIRNFSYGGGPFVRIYPAQFLFLQAQYEKNWGTQSEKPVGYPEQKYKYNSNSFIAGIGYTQRVVGQTNFYTMIGWDLLNDVYSPYRLNGSKLPVIRAGINFYLQPSRRK